MLAFQKVRADSETQQNAIVACERAFQQLWLSSQASVTTTSVGGAASRNCMAFLSSQPAERGGPAIGISDMVDTNVDTHPVVWQKVVIFYHDAQGRAVRIKEIPYTGGSRVGRLAPEAIRAYLSNVAWPSRLVTTGIQKFTVSEKFPPVHVEVVARGDYRGDEGNAPGAVLAQESSRDRSSKRETTMRFDIAPRL
jgi:hypothetical protein